MTPNSKTCLIIVHQHLFFLIIIIFISPNSFLWKVDIAAQTPLNNENVLSGSSSSSAKPVSCQTVNTVFQQWVGGMEKLPLCPWDFNAAVSAAEQPSWGNSRSVRSLWFLPLEPYNSSCLPNPFYMLWFSPATPHPLSPLTSACLIIAQVLFSAWIARKNVNLKMMWTLSASFLHVLVIRSSVIPLLMSCRLIGCQCQTWAWE